MAAANHDATVRSVSDEDCGRAMFGDAIHQATEAFLEELIDFSPDPKVRRSLRKIIAESKVVRGLVLDQTEQVLESFGADREANGLGLTMSTEDAQAAEEFGGGLSIL